MPRPSKHSLNGNQRNKSTSVLCQNINLHSVKVLPENMKKLPGLLGSDHCSAMISFGTELEGLSDLVAIISKTTCT